MAVCAECKRPITGADARKQKVLKDDDGRLVAILHWKCYYIRLKRGEMGDKGLRVAEIESAYEARYTNRDDIEESRGDAV